MKNKFKIGFIGQGYIGKNYADDMDQRGFETVRYALEDPYKDNKDLIKTCDIVFIAVPTPTTHKGFDGSIVRKSVVLTKEGAIVVIKSTILPGMSQDLQKEFKDRIILFSPEFLREKTAAYDAANPKRNIVGVNEDSQRHREAAETVLKILPKAPFEKITDATSAEFLKYISNSLPYTKIMFLNTMYDLVQAKGGDWESVKDLLEHDPYIAPDHLDPVHNSGRGVGGHCLIKDFAAIRGMYEDIVGDVDGVTFLKSVENMNRSLLLKSKKDEGLFRDVYGE